MGFFLFFMLVLSGNVRNLHSSQLCTFSAECLHCLLKSNLEVLHLSFSEKLLAENLELWGIYPRFAAFAASFVGSYCRDRWWHKPLPFGWKHSLQYDLNLTLYSNIGSNTVTCNSFLKKRWNLKSTWIPGDIQVPWCIMFFLDWCPISVWLPLLFNKGLEMKVDR